MSVDVLAFSDPLGPRGRRRMVVASVVSTGVVLVLMVLAVNRLADQNQLAAKLWRPLVSADGLRFFATGVGNTLRAALVAMALAFPLGLVLAVGRQSRRGPVRRAVAVWIELIRGIPLLLLITFLYFGLPAYGLDLGRYWFLVMGLTLYNSAVMAEIVRAGVLSLPSGQAAAARALGLTEGQALRLVVLPQALRRMLPALVAQMVILLKDTSLGVVIGYEELLRRGQIAGSSQGNTLQALVVAAVLYLLVNLLLSWFARWLERRQDRRATGGPTPLGADVGLSA